MEKLKLALKENYNIEAIDIKRIEYGLWEENFQVKSSDQNYFVKRFWLKSRLEDRYDQMIDGILLGQELRNVGIPAPLHINDKKNNILSCHGTDTYQVNEWVDGNTYRPGDVPLSAAYSMGKLLGKLHITMNSKFDKGNTKNIIFKEALKRKEKLIESYQSVDFDGKYEILDALRKQVLILKSSEFTKIERQFSSCFGKVYKSYWIEQLIFDEKHDVIALIDWTDGAGSDGGLVDDIDTAIFVSAFDIRAICSFIKGYQESFALSEAEWKSIIEYVCTRHLDTNWIYHSWKNQNSNRFEHWKTIARKWISGIEYRACNMSLIKESVIKELRM